MTALKNLIDPGVAEALGRMTADAGGTLVVDASQMGQCEFCHDDVVLAGPPVPGTVVSCKECAKARVGGDRAPVARRPRTARHQPRLKPTPEEQASAEAKMTPSQQETFAVAQDAFASGDLTGLTDHLEDQARSRARGRVDARKRPVHTVNVGTLSDAELGRMVRSGLLSLVVEGAPTSKAAADRTSDEALAELRRLLSDERSQRTIMAGFTCRTIEVPPLDLTDVILDSVVPSKVRSPYNRLRYRLSESVLDPETTTYRILITEHMRLAQVVDVPAPTSTTTMTKKAKIDALVETLGMTRAEAKATIEDMG